VTTAEFSWFEVPATTKTGATRQTHNKSIYHKRLRAELETIVATGQAVCWRCGKSVKPDSCWDLGHDDFDPSIHRGVEHRSCNNLGAATVSPRGRAWPTVRSVLMGAHKPVRPDPIATAQLEAAQQAIEQQAKQNARQNRALRKQTHQREQWASWSAYYTSLAAHGSKYRYPRGV
jgi:hypothetical protein